MNLEKVDMFKQICSQIHYSSRTNIYQDFINKSIILNKIICANLF